MSPAFKLRDLLEEPSLGLDLVVGSDDALERRVAGAHSIEVCEPSRWLDPDWVVLTTGSRMRHDPECQQRLIHDAHHGDLAAVGFATGVDFDTVPEQLLTEARSTSFPIFTIPFEVPLRTIVDFVNRSSLSEQMYVMQRASGAQAYLLDALSANEPRQVIVRRLRELLHGDVALFRYDGNVEFLEGAPPGREVWDEVCSREPRLQDFELGDQRVLSIPVSRFLRRSEWLVARVSRLHVHPQVARDVLRSASRLLGLVSQARDAVSAERRRIKSRLLERLLWSPEDADAIRHAADYGLDLRDAARIVVFEPEGDARPQVPANGAAERAEECAVTLESILMESHVPHLLSPRGTQVLAFVQPGSVGAQDVESWLEGLAEQGMTASAGLSAPVAGMADIAAGLQDATLAVQWRSNDRSPQPRVYSFEDFSLAEWLLTHSPAQQARSKSEHLLEPLREHPDLLETLAVYLRSDMKIKQTARVLHLHPNSVRYRLERVEGLLDRSLQDISALVDLYLALRVEALGTVSRPESGRSQP